MTVLWLGRDCRYVTCGSSLYLSNDCIVVREGLLCSSIIETQYYSSVLVHFPPICYFCGLGEECLINNEEIQDLKTPHATVMPICLVKITFCRKPSNVSKKQKTSVELYVVSICIMTCVPSLYVSYNCICTCTLMLLFSM